MEKKKKCASTTVSKVRKKEFSNQSRSFDDLFLMFAFNKDNLQIKTALNGQISCLSFT